MYLYKAFYFYIYQFMLSGQSLRFQVAGYQQSVGRGIQLHVGSSGSSFCLFLMKDARHHGHWSRGRPTLLAGPNGNPDCKSLDPRDNVITRLNDNWDLFLHRCMESGLQYRYQASWASILEVIKVTFEVDLAYNKIFHVVSCFMCVFFLNLFNPRVNRPFSRRELRAVCLESVKSKAKLSRVLNISRTTITSLLSKYRRTGSMENLTQSGRKKSFTNEDRNALSVWLSDRRFTLQDITAKLVNKCKTKTFSKKTVQRVLHLGEYKRLAKKKMVVREANRKSGSQVWRGRTVNNNWKNITFSNESQIVLSTNNHVYISRKEDKVQLASYLSLC